MDIKKKLKVMRIRHSNHAELEVLKDYYAKPKLYAKQMWVTQAKQLIRLFNVDLKAMVNGLIKINDEYDVDFSFIDKVLTNMVGIQKQDLLQALRINDNSPRSRDAK